MNHAALGGGADARLVDFQEDGSHGFIHRPFRRIQPQPQARRRRPEACVKLCRSPLSIAGFAALRLAPGDHLRRGAEHDNVKRQIAQLADDIVEISAEDVVLIDDGEPGFKIRPADLCREALAQLKLAQGFRWRVGRHFHPSTDDHAAEDIPAHMNAPRQALGGCLGNS